MDLAAVLPSQRPASERGKRLPLRYYPDPVLRERGIPVVFSEEIQKLSQDMLTTMVSNRGIGLAAQQIGKPLQMFVANVDWRDIEGGFAASEKSYVFINPVILSYSETHVTSVEGCLSFPEEMFELPRAKSVVITALDYEGKPFTLTADGLLSVVIQHEYDHCQGVTFVDHKGPLTRKFAAKAVQKRLAKAGIR